MELNGILQVIIGAVASLGGFSLIKFLFFMQPEKRKARAEAESEAGTDETESSENAEPSAEDSGPRAEG